MAGTLTPASMFAHVINEMKGRGDLLHALDFAAAPDTDSGVVKYAGSVMTLNSSGKFVAGLGNAVTNVSVASKAPMAIFALQGQNDFDANSDVGNMSGGVMSGLVATGGYEIQTTEFVAGTYNPNTLLTFGLTSDRGKVTAAADNYSDNHIVGVVSRGTETNVDGVSLLTFWTVFLPVVRTSLYSLTTHNHDGVYSPVGHTHA